MTYLETLYDCNIDEVNAREQYWIKQLNTFRGNGQGYNSDLGGNNRERSRMLSADQVQDLKTKIKNGTPYIDLEKEYKVSASYISNVNNGVYYGEPDKEAYPLFKYYKTDEDYSELIDLLLNSSYSLQKIADMLEMGYSTVKKINAGTLRPGLYPNYPIRKYKPLEVRANNIKHLLLTTNMSNAEIAKATDASEETVRRIKIGETFRDSKLTYPLSNL